MEINQEILYIIFGVIYFIYSLWQNLRKKPVTREEEEPVIPEATEQTPRRHRRETVSKPFDETVGRPTGKPTSFEELLEQFGERTDAAERKASEKVKKVQEVDDEYQPVFKEADRPLTELEAERQIRETEARKSLQEKASAAKRAEVVDKEVRRKINETITGPTYSAEEEVVSKRGTGSVNRRRQQILNMLKNPDNVTNTILASEILRRKHF